VACGQGEFASAVALLDECFAIMRELGDRGGIANALHSLGNAASDQGDFVSAQARHAESLAIRRELGDRNGIAASLGSLGMVAYQQGDFPAARMLVEESLVIRRELRDRRGIAYSLEELAAVVAAIGSSLRAACIWGAAERLREEIGSPLYSKDRPRYNRRVAAARAALKDDAAFDQAWQEGRALTHKQAIELALAETVERP
jgi:tetratricopeptide (TPR) repeat protein